MSHVAFLTRKQVSPWPGLWYHLLWERVTRRDWERPSPHPSQPPAAAHMAKHTTPCGKDQHAAPVLEKVVCKSNSNFKQGKNIG